MAIACDVLLRWSATPDQLTALGTAWWRWCNRSAGDAGIYQYLDNQALADLIAGKLPTFYQALCWWAGGAQRWVRIPILTTGCQDWNPDPRARGTHAGTRPSFRSFEENRKWQPGKTWSCPTGPGVAS